MGFLSSLFGGKSKEQQEMEAIFKKIDFLLNDEEAQVNILSSELINKLNREPMDQLPTAVGEFGRNSRNPILCNGPLGEITYLSKLLIPTYPHKSKTVYLPVTFHRIGTVQDNIDEYEIISYDGILHDVLYLDMYHLRKSKNAPQGYVLQESVVGFRGTNMYNEKFPYGQDKLTAECAERMLSFPAYDTKLKDMEIEQAARTIQFLRNFDNQIIFNWWDN